MTIRLNKNERALIASVLNENEIEWQERVIDLLAGSSEDENAERLAIRTATEDVERYLSRSALTAHVLVIDDRFRSLVAKAWEGYLSDFEGGIFDQYYHHDDSENETRDERRSVKIRAIHATVLQFITGKSATEGEKEGLMCTSEVVTPPTL
jgi:hypothetical protein